MEQKIEHIRQERKAFDETEDGKILKKLKSKIYRAKTGLKRLGAIQSVPGVATTAINSPNEDFLREVIDFIENEVDVTEDESVENEDDVDANANGPNAAGSSSSSPELSNVERRVKEIQQIITDSEAQIVTLKKKREKIENR